MTDPKEVTRDAFVADVERVGELLAMLTADALILDIKVPGIVIQLTGELDRWAKSLR
ncbi:MAG TPA: hypothetical protein VG276_11410 [Actinomycetes bacterium]|jgi:hypothetical protein|nr:hypothetical protein [Actinomycetes bacterium]